VKGVNGGEKDAKRLYDFLRNQFIGDRSEI